jgi:Tannase and feruloyl esterase
MPNVGWDGRLMGAGNGGFAGSISYMELAAAIKAGQAGASTDTGHNGNAFESSWAKGHPERVRDYGWRAIHLTAITAKKLITIFYSHAPDHSYFMSCSNGGRQALMEASRFPDDYDGLVAGAPAAVLTDLAMSMIGTVQAQLPPGAAIRPEQAQVLQSAVLQQCDAQDGQSDGLVADPRRCKFDPSRLACEINSSQQCFTPPQLVALNKISHGPHDAAGNALAAGYLPSGSEVGVPIPLLGWQGWILAGQKGPVQHQIFTAGLLSDFTVQPIATPQTFDFERDPRRLKAALAADLDAKPLMRAFFERGGKLIIWHGWADAAIPPQASVDFHESVLRNSGPKAKQSTRLFMVPGVQHCFGGPGPDMFGQIGALPSGESPERNIALALQAWVESGRVPASLVGRRGFGEMIGAVSTAPEKERLICAYPNRDVLRRGADPDQASSYECQL